MTICEIEKNIAIPFIQQYHYSKILPSVTKKYLGVFENEELLGVVTLGYGTQPLGTIKKIFYKHQMKSQDYIEIGKMCFLPKMNNSNFGSSFIKILVKWVKENMKDVLFLYTLADGIMGKVGYVYQASNFRYIGYFKTSVYRDKHTGEKIHPRSSKSLCIENAKYENKKKVFWLTHSFCEFKGIEKINGVMFRYIYPLNKDANNMLKAYKEYTNKKYPKEKDLFFEKRVENGKFEKIPPPKFNMDFFQYNYQKPNKVKQLTLF